MNPRFLAIPILCLYMSCAPVTSPTDPTGNTDTSTSGSAATNHALSAYLGTYFTGTAPNISFYQITSNGIYYTYIGTSPYTYYFTSNESAALTNNQGRMFGKIYTNSAGGTNSGTWIAVGTSAYAVYILSNVVAQSTAYLRKFGSPSAPLTLSQAAATNGVASAYTFTNFNPVP